jgi:hypothetical protein
VIQVFQPPPAIAIHTLSGDGTDCMRTTG